MKNLGPVASIEEVDVPAVPNYLLLLSDNEILHGELSLALACNRTHSAIRRKHTHYTCGAFRVFQLERDRRGLSALGPPWHG